MSFYAVAETRNTRVNHVVKDRQLVGATDPRSCIYILKDLRTYLLKQTRHQYAIYIYTFASGPTSTALSNGNVTALYI